MDLSAAISKHAEWKTRFRKAIDAEQQMDVATLRSDCQCELGKWLHGPGKARFSALESYAGCVRQHAAFHAEAAKVAVAINARKYADATAMIGSGAPYAQASSNVGVAIMRLKKEAGV